MALKLYTPEMNEQRPANAVVDAMLGHYGNHWFIKTPLTLSGRGIKFRNTLTSAQLTPAAQHKVGWNEYLVTEKAFEKICAEHEVASENLL